MSAPRARTGLRHLCITGAAVGGAGAIGHLLSLPLLTATLGPTAYVLSAHPDDESARLRNATVGHAVAVASGLGALAVCGLWSAAPLANSGGPGGRRIAASVLAVGVTLVLLEALRSHHAPAAATTLLVATGMARPGPPLAGLVLGLVVVAGTGMAFAYVQARRPRHRHGARGRR